MDKPDVVILGASIGGMLAAVALKHRLPDLHVVVVGPEVAQEKRPYVGESLVEPAMLFLTQVGLEPCLLQNHALKNGLTFYHKLRPDTPADRCYTVHAPHKLHYLSRQLNRPVFDRQLRTHAASLGAQFLTGKVEDVELGHNGAPHRILATGDNGLAHSLTARWVIDATGRTRLLGRKVTQYIRPPLKGQRSALWFRLADFEPFTPHIQMSMRRPLAYDIWYSTHHFMGRGNWMWGIPLQSDEHERMISVGITYRPDIFPHPMQTLEHFLAYVDREHPAMADMVRSGKVLDLQAYRNYLYWARDIYSPDGWFLIGDAARSVDPLYSTGLSMTVVQAQQITEIIRRQQHDAITADDIGQLALLWQQITDQRQRDITNQYETMHDPFQACMRRYWNICGWFNAILPLWFNGFFNKPDAARLLNRLIPAGDPAIQAAWTLFGQVSRKLGEVTQADFDRTVDFDWLINHRFDCDPKDVPRHLSRMLWKRCRLRWNMVRLSGYRHLPEQAPFLIRECLLSGMARLFLRRAKAFSQTE